jgi:serine/threonine protein phosphatase PrpC
MFVANCGDSQAIMLRKEDIPSRNKYIPIKIMNIHNASNHEEQIKLRNKFKNERSDFNFETREIAKKIEKDEEGEDES